jgi:uncharacterized membrane protein
MDHGQFVYGMVVALAVLLVVVGSVAAVSQYRFSQQCHEEYDDSTVVYAECEDFVYAAGLYGGSTLAVIGVGLLVLVVDARRGLAPPDQASG